ncbi:MAG: ATP-binding cassette domain-containing protein [Planctomycetota bacterium]
MTSSSTQPVLRVRDVRFGYARGHDLFAGVSLDVGRGEVHALLGPSGCGKSTLLRLIAGLERPASGRIECDSQVLTDGGTFVPPHRRGVGIVFQDLGLFPDRSAVSNVMFGIRGPRRAARARAKELLRVVGVGDEANRPPGQLSGGQRRRVAIARALGPEPRVMLLDEAFEGLESDLRRAVRNDVFGILRSRGIASVLVTHDEQEAEAVADRVVRLPRLSRT